VQKQQNQTRCQLWLTHVGTRNHILDGGYDQTNPFAGTKGDKSAMWLIVKLFWILHFISMAFNSLSSRTIIFE